MLERLVYPALLWYSASIAIWLIPIVTMLPVQIISRKD